MSGQRRCLHATQIYRPEGSGNRISNSSTLLASRFDEADNPWSIHKKYRQPLVEIAANHGIKANFAGHWHRNNYAMDKGIDVITSGPVGYPLGDDPSGFRVVEVTSAKIEHKYYSLEEDDQQIG